MQAAAASSAGWSDLIAAFSSSGLPTPPVPQSLRTRLRTPQQWCWTTRDINPLQMYLFDHAFVVDVLAGNAADYVAVSHAGHGTNSYAINYHLVHGHLAIIMQVGWGGIYTDNAAKARRLQLLWSRCDRMLQRDTGDALGRLLCVYSDIRRTSACGWIPATHDDNDVGQFLLDHQTTGERAFDLAEQLLTSPSS